MKTIVVSTFVPVKLCYNDICLDLRSEESLDLNIVVENFGLKIKMLVYRIVLRMEIRNISKIILEMIIVRSKFFLRINDERISIENHVRNVTLNLIHQRKEISLE